jgi:hypothetical protein
MAQSAVRRAVLHSSPIQSTKLNLVIAGVVFLGGVIGIYSTGIFAGPHHYELQVVMASSVADTAQVFYDLGKGYNEEDSSISSLIPSSAARRYRFKLPTRTIYSLRFDVLSHEGRVLIRSGVIVNEHGTQVRSFVADDFTPVQHLRIVERTPSALTLETSQPPAGQLLDPVSRIRLEPEFKPEPPVELPLRVVVLYSGLGTVALLCAVAAWRRRKDYARLSDPDAYFHAAMLVTILFTFVHVAALPLVVSYDGMEYAHLANVLLSQPLVPNWDFLRTPLFPLVLKAMFQIAGEQQHAALLVPAMFGLGGVLLMGSAVRQIVGNTGGAAALILMVGYPILIGYQHMLLSETGTFFFLAFLLRCLVSLNQSSNRQSLIFPVVIAATIVVGYYWRPTIVYLSPFVAIVYVLVILAPSSSSPKPYTEMLHSFRKRISQCAVGTLLIGIGPWLGAYPWLAIAPQKGPDTALPIGAYKQALIPPGDPSLGSLNTRYAIAVQSCSTNGRLSFAGLRAFGPNSDLMPEVVALVKRIGMGHLIVEYPFRYLAGVVRTAIFFLGLRGYPEEDENNFFSHAVFRDWPTGQTMEEAVGWNKSLDQFTPEQYSGGGELGRVLDVLFPVYNWGILAASSLSFGWLFSSIWKANVLGITMAGIPIAFLLLHALTLLTAVRYVVPIQPLFLGNLVIVVFLSSQRVLRRAQPRPTRTDHNSQARDNETRR